MIQLSSKVEQENYGFMQENYGFKNRKCPPHVEELISFEIDIMYMVKTYSGMLTTTSKRNFPLISKG